MPVRSATAEWQGNLANGSGKVSSESGHLTGAYSFPSRFETGNGTNPEELIAAAHAACYSMALSHALSQAGHVPESVQTEAKVHLEKGEAGFSIVRIELLCEARVSGLDDASFQTHAEGAKEGCPISRALASVEISLEARNVGG